jgi:hypothetical protein
LSRYVGGQRKSRQNCKAMHFPIVQGLQKNSVTRV